MTTSLRWTVHDLDAFPDDGKRREIIDGELYVTTPLNIYHQLVCGRLQAVLDEWTTSPHTARATRSARRCCRGLKRRWRACSPGCRS